jgi:hypothetical protein
VLRRQQNAVQGAVLLQRKTSVQEEGGPAAAGYHAFFARRL